MSKPGVKDLADLNSAGRPLPAAGSGVLLNPDFWASGLIHTDKGQPKRCVANVMHVLSLHPEWIRVLAWDAFGMAVVTRKRPPMRPQDAPEEYAIGDWTDEDSVRTAAWFAEEVGFEPTSKMVDEAVQTVARRHVVHPVRDWLSSLKWDGTERLSQFAATYLGAADSKYAAAVGRRWMIAAVARVFEPGCKVDSLLGLEGAQGIGKSSALRLLAGNEWFADSGIEIGTKDSYQALRRKWVFELAELSSIRGKEIERVKNFLSSQVDTYRASYGKRTQDHPRQVVFAGSTNEQHYLTDSTGSRRFWPLKCHSVDLAGIKRDRAQLWAEARTAYQAGEPWYLDTPELHALAAEEQATREEQDPWQEIVEGWLTSATNKPRLIDEGVTTSDVLLSALNFTADRIKLGDSQRVGKVLRKLKWGPRQIRESGDRARRYYPNSDGNSDDDSAKNGSCHSVTDVTDGSTYTQGEVSGDLYEGGKATAQTAQLRIPHDSCGTSVTVEDDADERAAIREEM